jgi:hypothetical protein
MHFPLVGMVGTAIGFGVGCAVFSWQPWSSGVDTHDAEVASLKTGTQTSASCERRE